jgi:hypothetical protein
MADPISAKAQEIAEKIAKAKRALAEKKKRERQAELERQREHKIQLYCEQVRQGLMPLRDQLQESLEECAILGEEDPTYQELKQKWEEITQQIEDPRSLAEEMYQDELEREELLAQQKEWEEQAALEEKRMEEEVNQWRQDLFQDLLQTIESAENYFEASDIAIHIRDYKEDLLAIDALEPTLVRLIERLNKLNTRDTVLELRYPIDATLNRMADFAMNQRMQGSFFKGTNGSTQLKQSHRRQTNSPFEYKDVVGKVVVYGGHPRMQRNVARRLPFVNLIWFNQEEGVSSMVERSDVVKDADLVILVTAYTSHKVQKIAQSNCDSYGLTLTYQNSTGIGSMLELIAVELKKKQLTRAQAPRKG